MSLGPIVGLRHRITSTLRHPRAVVVVTIGTNFILLGLTTLSGIVAARALGPSGRGVVALLFTWAGVLQLLGTLGLPHAVFYMSARFPLERVTLSRYAQRVTITHSLASTLVTFAIFGYFSVSRGIGIGQAIPFGLWVIPTTVSIYACAWLGGEGRFQAYNLVRLACAVSTTVMVLAFAAVGTLTVQKVGVAYLTGAIASAVLSLICVWPAISAGRGGSGAPYHRRRAIWSFGWRNLASNATGIVNNRVDLLMLSLVGTNVGLGLYAVAATAATIGVPFATGVSIHAFKRVASASSPEEERAIAKRLVTATAAISLVTTVALWLSAPMLIGRVFGPQFAGAGAPARVLAIGGFFVALNLVMEDALRGQGKPGVVAIAELLGGAVTAAGVVVVASRGIVAVAWLATAGYAVSTVVCVTQLFGWTSGAVADGPTAAVVGTLAPVNETVPLA